MQSSEARKVRAEKNQRSNLVNSCNSTLTTLVIQGPTLEEEEGCDERIFSLVMHKINFSRVYELISKSRTVSEIFNGSVYFQMR